MNRRLFVLILLTLITCAAVFAQDKVTEEKIAQVAVFEEFPSLDGSYLGVQLDNVTRENFSKLGLSEVRGVAVKKVVPDSPAAKANLQEGDVIVRFNGEEVTSLRKLQRLIGEVAPDHQARITIVRGGREQEVTATIGKRPLPRFGMAGFGASMPAFNIPMPRMAPMAPIAPMAPRGDVFVWKDGESFALGSHRQIGIGVADLTKQLGEYFGVSDGKGLLIDNVLKGSPAEKANLKAGDVIVEVEGKPVDSAFDLVRAINQKKEGEISLTIVRNRDRQTVKVTPEKIKPEERELRWAEEDGEKGARTITITPRVRVERRPGTPGAVSPAVRVVSNSMIL